MKCTWGCWQLRLLWKVVVVAGSSSSSQRSVARRFQQWCEWSCQQVDDEEHVLHQVESTRQSSTDRPAGCSSHGRHSSLEAPRTPCASAVRAGVSEPLTSASTLLFYRVICRWYLVTGTGASSSSDQRRQPAAAAELSGTWVSRLAVINTTLWWLCALSNASNSCFTTCSEGKLFTWKYVNSSDSHDCSW